MAVYRLSLSTKSFTWSADNTFLLLLSSTLILQIARIICKEINLPRAREERRRVPKTFTQKVVSCPLSITALMQGGAASATAATAMTSAMGKTIFVARFWLEENRR
ncbi:hypothetical protein DL96DRAFT_1631528 [Flagelloscypha sp. PMI_526]|nr:hypothetical protein DL96DRAFT_1631528 [Flagelloscypha sp. PMI_526]